MRRLVWIAILLAGFAALGIGAAASRPQPAAAGPVQPDQVCLFCPTTTTSTSTTTTTTVAPPSTTTTTTAPPPSPYATAFLPCGSSPASCDQAPTQIQVQYQTPTPPDAIQVDWITQGRSARAPSPNTPSVTLAAQSASSCGTQVLCWGWPGGMTDGGFVLNGSYQVSVCPTGTYTPPAQGSTQGSCSQPVATPNIGLAVPPGPPTGVTAKPQSSAVLVSWKPPASQPPDLAGYAVSRNGHPVYGCSIDGLASSAPACPNPLSYMDHPGTGTFAYTVNAYRLGSDPSGSQLVGSTAAGTSGSGKVSVTGRGGGTGGSGGTGNLPGTGGSVIGFSPSPVIGGGTVVGDAGPHSAAGVQGLGGAEGAPALGGVPPQNLHYSADNPVLGNSSAALALKVPPGRTDVVPVAVLALGILILAIAAHVLYLRVELSVLAARPEPSPPRSS